MIAALLILFTHISFSQQAQDALRPDLGDKLGTCNACGMDVFEKMLTKVEITTVYEYVNFKELVMRIREKRRR